MDKKSFIITIDTESDNQWDSSHEQSTVNAHYIPRFQELCENYGLKPTYLVDYSMGRDLFLIKYLKGCLLRGTCEVGMHLHAWDTPPRHEYDSNSDARPYLIEYPINVMRDKMKSIHQMLTNNFECDIISHRAGRWVTNNQYFDLLSEIDYKIDCSVTPGISWKKTVGAWSGGSDYSQEKDSVSYRGTESLIMEIPMTLKKVHVLEKPGNMIQMLKEPIKLLKGRYWWLRPALSTNEMMIKILENRQQDYAEFMLHSSELMPSGSPYFRTNEDIERLYVSLEDLFKKISDIYEGCTLTEYYQKHKK